jgi:chaperonin GroEL
MPRIITFNEEARAKIKAGVDKLANAVKVTLGPRGRNVVVDRGFGVPMVTKDGVSVAKEVSLEDPLENIGAALVREAASKTNDIAGDGTTTATVIAQAIVSEGMRVISAGSDSQAIRRGLEAASEAVIARVKEIATPVEGDGIEQVASISANDKEIGALVAEAIEKVGKDGVITVEDGQTAALEMKVVEGMQFDRGYTSPYMVTDTKRLEAEYRDVPILVTDQKIENIDQILGLLEPMAKSGKKEIVIIADEIRGEALNTLNGNKLRGLFKTLAVAAPGFGDRRRQLLEDIAALVGTEVISPDLGRKLEDVKFEDLGFAKRVTSTSGSTTIVEGRANVERVEIRVATIRRQIEEATTDFDKEKLRERLAKLTGGIAVIKVGGASEAEMLERKHRVIDAVAATKAALEEGIVAGGGSTLIRVRMNVTIEGLSEEEEVGSKILYMALEAPITQIMENAGRGKLAGSVIDKIESAHTLQNNPRFGFDAKKLSLEPDMIKAGIIDPAKVTCTAIQNAVSAAIMILTTECAITEIPEPKDTTLDQALANGL